MQAFAILLLAANLALSALAAPMANGTISVRASYGGPNPYGDPNPYGGPNPYGAFNPYFPCGPQVGTGGFINHSTLV